VHDSTIAGNEGNLAATGGIDALASSQVTLGDTILANLDGDCAGPAVTDAGHNLVAASTCAGLVNGVNGNQLGVDPHLAPLAANGGPTQTRALQLGSPAFDAGDPGACSATDQRNVNRKTSARAACDVGAYDTAGVALQTLYVKHTAPSDPACAAASQANPFA